jgi:hypothetical protein
MIVSRMVVAGNQIKVWGWFMPGVVGGHPSLVCGYVGCGKEWKKKWIVEMGWMEA